MTKKRSPEDAEKRLLELLGRSADGPEWIFTWNLSGRAARIKQLPSGGLRTEINLRFILEAETDSEGAWEFWLRACTGVIGRRLRLEEEAAVSAPGSYLQGLAQIEVLDERSRAQTWEVYIPTKARSNARGRRIRLTAAGLFCAVEGLRNVIDRYGCLLSPEELEQVQNAFRTLELLSNVPEVVFFGSKIPESSIVWCVKTMERLLERGTRTAPVLNAVSDESGRLCSPAQIMAQMEDPLCRGMALRLFAASGSDFAPLLTADPAIRNSLEEVAHEFRECSVAFAKACRQSEHKVLRDNLLALERMSARLNAAMGRHGMPCRSGRIHPLA